MSQTSGNQLPSRGSPGCAVGVIVALLVGGLLLVAMLVAVVALIGFRMMQRDSGSEAARAQAAMLGDAVQLYQVNTGSLPPNLDALTTPPADPALAEKWNGPYLQKPAGLDPWGKPFRYEVLSPELFRIWSAGPDGITPSPDDIDSLR